MICLKSVFCQGVILKFNRILFFLSLFIPSQLNAQNYFFDTYGVAEGIAQSTVFDILQDHNDYVWLGTRAGVSRFDGKEFVNYTMEDGLAENGVRVLYQDENNIIWLGHYGGGVSMYDGHSFRIFTETDEIFTSDITSISGGKDNCLWITSELSGAVRITGIGSTLRESDFEHFIGDKLSDRIFGAYAGKDNTVYFITDAFIKIYSPETNDFKSFSPEGMPSYFIITSVHEDQNNNLWFGTYHGGLYKYIASQDTFRVFDLRDGLASNWISYLTEDQHGNMWVGTWGGGISVIKGNGIFNYDETNGLPDLKIRNILEDAEGNILIGTDEKGLTIFKGENFITYSEKDGLRNAQVRAILQDSEGKFWFGTNEGVSLFRPEYPADAQFSDFYKLRIWIGTDDQGIFTFNPVNGAFTYEPLLNSYLTLLDVKALEPDDQGRIWAGTLDGLVSYDYDERNAEYYTQTSGIAGNEITTLFFDKNTRKLWVGSRGEGLSYMAEDSFRILDLGDKFTAKCMLSDQDGKLWVGTEARGILVIDPIEETIIHSYKESDGLLANLVNLLITDTKNNIYAGTNKGLNLINQAEDKIYSYTYKSGFVGIETKDNASFRDDEGYLWFGTISGVTRFDPFLQTRKIQEPLTHIINFKVNLQDRDMEPDLSLKYTEDNVIFEYISICLTNPDAVLYQIMLEGADNDWRPVTTQTTVTYPSLAPKKYTFKVKARNSDGVWNEEPITYQFRIKPPFYKTWWFILICVFSGAVAIVMYIKIRERNLVREKRILEDKVRVRTAEVVSQKEELAEKNKDITDSIRYAKRIQFAILPPEIPFKDTFILFKPKDIVSGDFYWIEIIDNMEFIAAVDCTGHGVPGAFMSIIGYNSLNKIVKERGVYEPGRILDLLDEEVIYNLRTQDDGTVYDGMDLALTCYHRDTGILEYAGAYNPLVLVRDNDIEEIKADRFSIGRSSHIEEKKNFTNHKIEIRKGDTVYIFSDGYADQFGGETGKKFKYKPLKELIIAINEKPMESQKEILDKTHDAWRGDINQVDDILVVGRRF